MRAAGFAIVTLADTAPALQLLYLVSSVCENALRQGLTVPASQIMMYIAVYPIAVSIRSTNVYEEKSMGAFNPGSCSQRLC